MAMMWGRPAPPLGRPAYCSPPINTPSWLLNSLTHTAIQLPKFGFPIPNLVVQNSIGRSSFGVREKGEKVESESVAKILSKRERGAAKI